MYHHAVSISMSSNLSSIGVSRSEIIHDNPERRHDQLRRAPGLNRPTSGAD